ncbi:MAG: NUDIX hydrolase [Gaiellales bacterium]
MAPVPDIAEVAAALAPTLGRHPDDATASVMVCLREGPRGTELLLCRRATREGDPWSGHVGLPGGGVEEHDADALAAAARETLEEVGFDPLRHGTVLGMLEPLRPRTFPITIAAYVAHVTEPVELVLSEEIAMAWWTPFADLAWVSAEVPEAPTRVSAYRLPHAEAQDVVLWGITYRLLDRLFRATGGVPSPE